MTSSLKIALAGAPNSGKSTLFNRLTGSHQKIGNYPGVTVEKKTGYFLSPMGRKIEVVDLPGTYSLDAQSADERVAVETIFGDPSSQPALVAVVCDATNLERGIGLVLELRSKGCPVIIALNMMDLASKRGLKIDLRKFQKRIGAPVVSTVAVKKGGTDALLNAIDDVAKEMENALPVENRMGSLSRFVSSADTLRSRAAEVDKLLAEVVLEKSRADKITEKLDAVLLHPLYGTLILCFLLFAMFVSVFSGAEKPMEWIESGIALLGESMGSLLPAGFVHDLITDGIIAGVGSVLVFLPQILIMFLFILFLEGTGYMARAAFLLNRMMSFVGLQGQAAVPLLSSFACAIPGLMAARTIKSPRERIITMMVAPLMTCSARLPVYVLLVGAFVPKRTVAGFLQLQGLVMFGLFATAVFFAMIVSFVLKKFAVKGRSAPFVMELPTYKIPSLGHLLLSLRLRAKSFLKRAGTTIMAISVILWFLSTFPGPPENADKAAIHYSFAGQVGHAIEPLVRPIGFDWRISAGLIPGFAAREVMVGALGTVFAVEDAEDTGQATLQSKLRQAWGLPTALSLLVWYIFSPQCLATFAVLRKESNSWKWTLLTFGYMLFLAYAGAFVTYQCASYFGAA